MLQMAPNLAASQHPQLTDMIENEGLHLPPDYGVVRPLMVAWTRNLRETPYWNIYLRSLISTPEGMVICGG